MIKCPSCTAQLEYDISSKKVKCDYCGCLFVPEELDDSLNIASDNINDLVETIKATSYNCDNCGATLLVYDDTVVTFCNYCGSSNMIKTKLTDQTKPDLIIPFNIDKDKCVELYKKTLKNNIFVPKYMLDDVVVSHFRGIYMPYEIYNFKASPKIVNKGEKYYETIDNYDYFHIYKITGDLNGYVNGLAYDGSSRFYDKYSEAIAPFNINEAKEFNISYISGFYADGLDIKEDLYSFKSLRNAKHVATHFLSKDKRFMEYGCFEPKAELEKTERKIAMYPVYFLGIRDRKNENIHYAVINGQTGKVAIDIPIDYKKYILFSLILAVPLYFIYTMFTMNMKTPLYISIGVAFLTTILSLFIHENLNVHDVLEKDIGYYSKNHEAIKKRKNKKNHNLTWTIIKPVLAFAIPLIILFSGLSNAIYYYVTAIISCLLILWNFYDIVLKYNKLSMHKIPQLEKRGGDE